MKDNEQKIIDEYKKRNDKLKKENAYVQYHRIENGAGEWVKMRTIDSEIVEISYEPFDNVVTLQKPHLFLH